MNSAGKGPERSCIACRQQKMQDQLVRYVVAPDGSLLVDYRHRLPGRGAYTCIDVKCLQAAVLKKQFQRSFRGQVKQVACEQLLADLRSSLAEKVFNLIGIARKSGQLLSGSNQVLAALRKGQDIRLVLLAEDISSGIAEKITGATERQQVSCEQMFDKMAYGQLLGKAERSVVAIQGGALAESLLNEIQRYKQIVREN